MDANGDVGLTNNGWGGASGPPTGILTQAGFVAGQTRHFQVFYRADDTLGCQTGQNTSQAVTTTFHSVIASEGSPSPDIRDVCSRLELLRNRAWNDCLIFARGASSLEPLRPGSFATRLP